MKTCKISSQSVAKFVKTEKSCIPIAKLVTRKKTYLPKHISLAKYYDASLIESGGLMGLDCIDHANGILASGYQGGDPVLELDQAMTGFDGGVGEHDVVGALLAADEGVAVLEVVQGDPG